MEKIITNGFADLSANEMDAISGGKWHWYDTVATVLCPAYGAGKMAYDAGVYVYNLGYDNGYNSVKH